VVIQGLGRGLRIVPSSGRIVLYLGPAAPRAQRPARCPTHSDPCCRGRMSNLVTRESQNSGLGLYVTLARADWNWRGERRKQLEAWSVVEKRRRRWQTLVQSGTTLEIYLNQVARVPLGVPIFNNRALTEKGGVKTRLKRATGYVAACSCINLCNLLLAER